ncbi:hypothetical protein IE53DRAFT_361105 [Violaceomyces palustris]|uniref:Uncharacterized protein n=1 Tax=Violaceomyces palustris TaxID=1673888 RepID=A0ACD0P1T9_9BASI|nr:hypothetical protein IE53DRAFT_361105 [Violaceomyces palustris]
MPAYTIKLWRPLLKVGVMFLGSLGGPAWREGPVAVAAGVEVRQGVRHSLLGGTGLGGNLAVREASQRVYRQGKKDVVVVVKVVIATGRLCVKTYIGKVCTLRHDFRSTY